MSHPATKRLPALQPAAPTQRECQHEEYAAGRQGRPERQIIELVKGLHDLTLRLKHAGSPAHPAFVTEQQL